MALYAARPERSAHLQQAHRITADLWLALVHRPRLLGSGIPSFGVPGPDLPHRTSPNDESIGSTARIFMT